MIRIEEPKQSGNKKPIISRRLPKAFSQPNKLP